MIIVSVVVVGLYLGAWEITKRFGRTPHRAFGMSSPVEFGFDTATAPFVISRVVYKADYSRMIDYGFGSLGPMMVPQREYHLWFLGHRWYVFEREISEDDVPEIKWPPVLPAEVHPS